MKHLKNSVQKTFAILEHFTSEKNEWGVTELAHAIGSNKSTVHRFLSDLEKLNILYKNPASEKYSLGLKLYELGNRVELQSALIDKTHPALIDLSNNINETVHIAILKSNQLFYIDKVQSAQGLTISSRIGSYNPLHCTALGKTLLAYQPKSEQERILKYLKSQKTLQNFTPNTLTTIGGLSENLATIKENGYAIDREEFELGLICVAIPIFNQSNQVVAALSASGPASRFEEKKVGQYVSILQAGANAIQESIGHFKPTIV